MESIETFTRVLANLAAGAASLVATRQQLRHRATESVREVRSDGSQARHDSIEPLVDGDDPLLRVLDILDETQSIMRELALAVATTQANALPRKERAQALDALKELGGPVNLWSDPANR